MSLNATMGNYDYAQRIPYGFRRLASFVCHFLAMNNYTHLTILRDDSYSFYTLWTKFLITYLQTNNPHVFRTTYELPFFSKTSKLEKLEDLLNISNEQSRCKSGHLKLWSSRQRRCLFVFYGRAPLYGLGFGGFSVGGEVHSVFNHYVYKCNFRIQYFFQWF